MHLSEMGKVTVWELEMAIIHKKNIRIAHYVVMPNHVHIVVSLQNETLSQRPKFIEKHSDIAVSETKY